MKFVRQFGIILGISMAAELLEGWLPLPVPASIYGLVIMLVLLMSGLLKIGDVKETADFLVEIMPLMFIPAAVGLIGSYHELDGILLPVIIVTVVTTVVVMAVTGRCAQRLIRRDRKKEEEKNGSTEKEEEQYE